jgi:hypothetical protein
MKDEAHDVEDEEQDEQEEVEVEDEWPSSVNSGKPCVLTSLLVIILAPDILFAMRLKVGIPPYHIKAKVRIDTSMAKDPFKY